MEAVWESAKNEIKKRIPESSFKIWIEPIELNAGEENHISLSCPNLFFKRRVADQFGPIIKEEINRVFGKACGLLFEVSKGSRGQKRKQQPVKSDPQLKLPGLGDHPSRGRLLRKTFTFDNFVVGNSNEFAYSAAHSLASKEKSNLNCLFLLSKTGMGRTHLSQAMGNFILSRYPSERVYYITAEDFTNEMVRSFKAKSIDKFKEKYRKKCDVLLLEDIHFLDGKERTQFELTSALDYLVEAKRKIIFTSNYLPSEIPKMSDELRSRLSSGLTSSIDRPDFRTRVRILQKKAKQYAYTIPDDVIQYLAGELMENVRQLESGLIGVAEKAALLAVPIDLDLAESVVRNIVKQRKIISIDVIKKVVCRHYGLTVKELVSRSRKQAITRPRQVAIFLSRHYTDQPLQAIGKSFNRYHATALHSIAAVERTMKENSKEKKQVEYLRKKIESNDF